MSSILLLTLLVASLSSSVRSFDFDVSAYIDCGVQGFVERNQRKCYRTRVEGDPCNPIGCNSTVIPRTNFSITLQPSQGGALQTKFWSPGNIRNPPRNYQNNRQCQYHLVCPAGQVLFFGFRAGNFDLEPAETDFCLDYVFVEDFSEGSFLLCGSQAQRSWTRAAPLRVEFRSNAGGRYPGFQIDAICVQPELGNQPGCTSPPPDNVTIAGRKKRATVDKRSVVSLVGNCVRVPREGSILYKNHVLKVEVNGHIVRTFRSIRRLIFWTGFRGVRAFYRSTNELIFGSGQLKIINNCAYYYTFDIPPQLEPTDSETELITLLLNATVAFIRDEDTEDTPTAPPTRFPPHLGLKFNFNLGVYTKKYHYKRSSYPHVHSDPRVSQEALATALNWQNACNVFLRESALSYLQILTENGISP